jgi:hypothetical protein
MHRYWTMMMMIYIQELFPVFSSKTFRFWFHCVRSTDCRWSPIAEGARVAAPQPNFCAGRSVQLSAKPTEECPSAAAQAREGGPSNQTRASFASHRPCIARTISLLLACKWLLSARIASLTRRAKLLLFSYPFPDLFSFSLVLTLLVPNLSKTSHHLTLHALLAKKHPIPLVRAPYSSNTYQTMSTTTPAATMAGVAAPPALEKKPVKFSNLLRECSHRHQADFLPLQCGLLVLTMPCSRSRLEHVRVSGNGPWNLCVQEY